MSRTQLELWMEEVKSYTTLDIQTEGAHIWDNYQKVIAIMLRVSEIRTEIAWLEVSGQASPQEKKFRTLVLDPLIDRLHEVATFESRKMTGRQIEANMEK